MDHRQVRRGGFWAILILDPVDVKRPIVTRHHDITVFNDMFDDVEHIMWDLARKKTQCKKDLYFAMKFAQQKLSKY